MGVALVAWVGLDRANQYLGVPAAVAGLLGLALSGYGVFEPRPDPDVTQVIQRAEIGGNVRMIGHASRTGNPESGTPGTADPGENGFPDVSQTITDAKILGNADMTGHADAGTGFQENA
jgi:hypothetical protein